MLLGNTVCAGACRRLRELQNKRTAAGGGGEDKLMCIVGKQ